MNFRISFIFIFISVINYAQIDSVFINNAINEVEAYKINKPKIAYEAYFNLLEESRNINFRTGEIKSYLGLGTTSYYKGDIEKFGVYIDSAISLSNKEKQTKLYIDGLQLKALYFYYTNRLESSKRLSLQALDLYNKYGITSKKIISTYQIVGAINQDYGNFEDARFYFKKAAESALLQNQERNYNLNRYSICNTYISEGAYTKGGKCLNKLQKDLEGAYSIFALETNVFIATDRLEMNPDENELARIYSNLRAIEKRENELPFIVIGKVDLYLNFVDYFLQVNKITNAEKYLRKCKKVIAENYNDITFKKRILKLETKIFKRKKDYKNALLNFEAAKQLNDSLKKESNGYKIKELNILYNLAKKDNLIKNKKLELISQKEKNTVRFTMLFTLIFLLIGFLIFYTQRQKLKDKEIERLKIKNNLLKLDTMVKGEEIERKRLSVDLHDGVNGTLAVIKYNLSSIDKEGISKEEYDKIDKSVELLDESVEIIRSISHNLEPPSLANYSLVESLKMYCDRIAKSSEIDIYFEYLGEALVLKERVEITLYRVLQELISNVSNHSKATEALVQINHYDDSLDIVVEDNGVGFNSEDEKKYNLGLRNFKSRVEFLKGAIEINSCEKGTNVFVNIDLNAIKNL